MNRTEFHVELTPMTFGKWRIIVTDGYSVADSW